MAIVTATADFEPLYKLSSLEVELEEIKFKGAVVFDLLVTNGFCDNRFIEISFDGKRFNKQSYKVKTRVNKTLRSYQNLFFRSQPNLLKTSILSTDEVSKFINENKKNLS